MQDKKKLTRHELREAVLTLLYQSELTGADITELLTDSEESFGLAGGKNALKFAEGVLENKEQLDAVIEKYSKTRKLERIPKINLTILRMAVYEMDFLPEIPDKVAMNEAIELSKEYACQPDTKLISGLLGSYYRDKHNEQ